jgi:hypothetical protein
VIAEVRFDEILAAHAIPVTVLIAGWLVLRFLTPAGKDRAFIGQPLAASRHEPGTVSFRTVKSRENRAGPVEFEPPESLPPALIAAALKPDWGSEAFVATIVDLATRGHLTIEEAESEGWRLTRTTPRRKHLATYEEDLLTALFQQRKNSTVVLAQLGGSFEKSYLQFLQSIDDEVKKRHWYIEPSLQMMAYLGVLGFVLIVFLPIWLVLLIRGTDRFGEVSLLTSVICSVVLGWIAWRRAYIGTKVSRTSAGSAMYSRLLGFQTFLVAGEHRLEHAERAQLYIDYLPHAIAMGIVDRWTERFADVTDQLEDGFVLDNVRIDVSTFGRRTREYGKQLATKQGSIKWRT